MIKDYVASLGGRLHTVAEERMGPTVNGGQGGWRREACEQSRLIGTRYDTGVKLQHARGRNCSNPKHISKMGT